MNIIHITAAATGYRVNMQSLSLGLGLGPTHHHNITYYTNTQVRLSFLSFVKQILPTPYLSLHLDLHGCILQQWQRQEILWAESYGNNTISSVIYWAEHDMDRAVS
jgi:hypothetical protein